MNNTTAWAVLSGSVLRLLSVKQLGCELLYKNTVLELHMTRECMDNFPVTYDVNNQTTLQRDLAQLDKELTIKIRHEFQHLLTGCLVLSEHLGSTILRVGNYYGYFQHKASMIEFLERLHRELERTLPKFDERSAANFFALHDLIVEHFFTAAVQED